MKELIKRIESRFNLLDHLEQRPDLLFLSMESKEVVETLTYLRDIENYQHLVMISAVDRLEDNVFQLTYLVHNYTDNIDIGIRTNIDRDHPVISSIHHLWPAAQVYQRELNELFGIDFPGSPRQDEPMMLEGWDNIPPMRRDFDTKKYSEETFFPREGRETYDPRKVMAEKSYPKENEIKHEIKKLVRDQRNK